MLKNRPVRWPERILFFIVDVQKMHMKLVRCGVILVPPSGFNSVFGPIVRAVSTSGRLRTGVSGRFIDNRVQIYSACVSWRLRRDCTRID